jgi:hypothetical protein
MNGPRKRVTAPGFGSVVTISICALGMGGCYHYTPANFGEVAPRMQVRASLTSEKALEMQSDLGVLRTQVAGEVLELDTGRQAFLLAVPHLGPTPPGASSARMRQWFWIEESDALRVEVRSLDRRQTGIVAGVAGAAVGYLLYRAVRGSVDTQEPNGGGNGTP